MKKESKNQKTHWKRLINPDYIGAYSLNPGEDLTVKITAVKREMVTGVGGKKDECTVAYLQDQKPFILNVTNQKTISKVIGSPYIEDWAGKQITLFATKCRFGSEMVECLRVRQQKPQLPELTPDHEKWAAVKKYIAGNPEGIAAAKTKFTISPENIKLLLTNKKTTTNESV